MCFLNEGCPDFSFRNNFQGWLFTGNLRTFLKIISALFTFLIIRQIEESDEYFSDQESIIAAIIMSLVAIPLLYWSSKRKDKVNRKKKRKLLWKLRWFLLAHYFKRKRTEWGEVLLYFILGAAAIVGLIVLLGWIAGLAAILALFLLIVFVIHPPD